MSQPEQQPKGPIAPDAITPVILCGGSGTRLWPLSTPEMPKPFLRLLGPVSLFQQTLERCRRSGFAPPVIVAGAAHEELVKDQSRGFDVSEFIIEPDAKQTAAAIALAAERLPGDALMLVCPSDHHIADEQPFKDAVLAGARLAAAGMLTCITIKASSAETGYGYVCRGEPLGALGYRVTKFVEKPDAATAIRLIKEGAAWNAGIFVFEVAAYLDELRLHRPDIAGAVAEAVEGGSREAGAFRPTADQFTRIEPESVDFAVMEHTVRAAMVEARMGWSDIGNWHSLHLARTRDAAGNSVHGEARLVDCRNIAVESDGARISCLGVEDLVVVAVGNEILVMGMSSAADIGKLGSAASTMHKEQLAATVASKSHFEGE